MASGALVWRGLRPRCLSYVGVTCSGVPAASRVGGRYDDVVAALDAADPYGT
ncbi:hypothetical protein LY15_004694 [Prauserella flava]|uniref:Uncharacterized protein n=1 Tax=Prauserella sediminis TaxID=577680 RepID=A0A839XPT1_9PSEU|nr:hypothetical protein [Prauserella sediminis]MCR3722689.1 hypothetical protein [Prauserella flava]MCR3737256.1 hypothetical protein [Prauserella salsuginis]